MDAFAPRYSIGPVRNLGIRSKKTHLNLRSAYERKKSIDIPISVGVGVAPRSEECSHFSNVKVFIPFIMGRRNSGMISFLFF